MPISAKVTVRRARAADVERVIEIERATIEASHWDSAVYAKYVGGVRDQLYHRCLLVAVEDEAVMGFAAGSFLEGDDAAFLEAVVVDSKWRRNGIATELCAVMAEWARSEGARAFELEVRAANAAARSLYGTLHFVEKGRRRDYYSNPNDDAVLMVLQLR